MIKSTTALTALFIIFLCCLNCAQAQSSNSGGKNELTVLGGGTFSSAKVIGDAVRDSYDGFAGIRYAHRFNNGKTVNLKYTLDLFPAFFITYPETVVRSGLATRDRRTVYGVGIPFPGGLQFNFLPRKKYQPFINLSTGFMYFTRRVPSEQGAKFNFTATVGAGLEIRAGEKRAVTLGYRFHHISNGDRAPDNRGFNTHDLYVGYTFHKW